jgi:hypothetical protein
MTSKSWHIVSTKIIDLGYVNEVIAVIQRLARLEREDGFLVVRIIWSLKWFDLILYFCLLRSWNYIERCLNLFWGFYMRLHGKGLNDLFYHLRLDLANQKRSALLLICSLDKMLRFLIHTTRRKVFLGIFWKWFWRVSRGREARRSVTARNREFKRNHREWGKL